jgi:hypothetical protein
MFILFAVLKVFLQMLLFVHRGMVLKLPNCILSKKHRRGSFPFMASMMKLSTEHVCFVRSQLKGMLLRNWIAETNNKLV